MSFFRPEINELLRRWAEALIVGTAAALLFGYALRGAMSRPIVVTAVLLAIGAAAAALTWIAAQKARIRGGAGEPGVVRIEETRITYFGPLNGGVAHLPDIQRISIQKGSHGALWVIEQADLPPLAIPVAARDADRLPEAFAALPGFWIGRAAKAIASEAPDAQQIWARP